MKTVFTSSSCDFYWRGGGVSALEEYGIEGRLLLMYGGFRECIAAT